MCIHCIHGATHLMCDMLLCHTKHLLPSWEPVVISTWQLLEGPDDDSSWWSPIIPPLCHQSRHFLQLESESDGFVVHLRHLSFFLGTAVYLLETSRSADHIHDGVVQMSAYLNKLCPCRTSSDHVQRCIGFEDSPCVFGISSFRCDCSMGSYPSCFVGYLLFVPIPIE